MPEQDSAWLARVRSTGAGVMQAAPQATTLHGKLAARLRAQTARKPCANHAPGWRWCGEMRVEVGTAEPGARLAGDSLTSCAYEQGA